MSLGLVVSEEKSLTRMRTSTPQSDDTKNLFGSYELDLWLNQYNHGRKIIYICVLIET